MQKLVEAYAYCPKFCIDQTECLNNRTVRRNLLSVFLFVLLEMASGEKGQFSNKWMAPVHVFCPGDRPLKSKIQSQTMVYQFSADIWEQACVIVDDVLDIILSELKTQAQRSFENLAIDVNFIRQGSARQGLKIVAPDEFDVIVPFQF